MSKVILLTMFAIVILALAFPVLKDAYNKLFKDNDNHLGGGMEW